MRKQLLTLAALLLSAAGYSQAISQVGASIEILPSSYWNNAAKWSARTYVINTGMDYYETMNEDGSNNYYSVVMGEPEPDMEGRMWFEPDYAEVPGLNELSGDSVYWETQNAPFSSDVMWGGQQSYQWTKNNIIADIYFRRTFSTQQLLSGPVYLACGHDDCPAEVYINGELVWSYEQPDHTQVGWFNNEVVLLTDEQKKLIKLGGEENVIAMHVHQNWGGAFADCGLYTKVEGGIDMGYITPWEGKVMFNHEGGYTSRPGHAWEKLYEAKEGDVYTINLRNALSEDYMGYNMVEFKTPINIQEDHTYKVSFTLEPSCDYSGINITMSETMLEANDDNALIATEEMLSFSAGEPTPYEVTIEGEEMADLKIVFDFLGGDPEAGEPLLNEAGEPVNEAGEPLKEGEEPIMVWPVKISNMSVYDETEGKELFIGCHYFNHCVNAFSRMDPVYDEDGVQYDEEENLYWAKDAIITGRVETLAWTEADFDDSMWEDVMMPIGNDGYMPELQSIWPGGDNTNFWIRRNFELDKVNERLSYALNVCHDDTYETYVNGHLLQKNTGWTDGKNPVQVHIPARYLNEGKNVIATYIQQNWGGKFYDCGINVEEVNYDECAKQLRDAIALGKTDAVLTQAMRDSLTILVAAGQHELETNKDAAEVKEYARLLAEQINEVIGWSSSVKELKAVWDYTKKIEDKGYLKDILASVDTLYDVCVSPAECNALRDELRFCRRINALERRNEPYVGVSAEEIEADGQYYILNVGQRMFLGGGENWGTHLALEYASNAFTLWNTNMDGEELEEGTYRIETGRPNGGYGNLGYYDFMNYGGYVDCVTDDAWRFVPVEGKQNVFNITRADDTTTMLGFRDGKGNGYSRSDIVVDTDMKGADSENNQWMLITKEEMDALMLTASAENVVDATHLIVNPGFDQRLPAVAEGAWMIQNDGGNCNIWGRGGNYPDFVFEGWNSNYFNLSQDIIEEALLPGWYILEVQGYYREGHYETHAKKFLSGEGVSNLAKLTCSTDDGEFSTYLMSTTDEANNAPYEGRLDETGTLRFPDACTMASTYFRYGLYKNQIVFHVPEGGDGYLNIAVIKEDAAEPGDWVVVDNFRIKYQGLDEADETAIKGIESDEVSTAAKTRMTVYNLAGQQLNNVRKGVNIVNGKKFVVK